MITAARYIPLPFLLALAAALMLAGTMPAAAQTISGPAEVIDGDTLSLTGIRVRLFGIDAPEAKQTCSRSGEAWACGEDARKALETLVEGNSLDCMQQDIDQYGRMVAICRAGSTDVGEAMVAAGFATAFRKYSEIYVETEAHARELKLGLWSSSFEPPAIWRAEHREHPPQVASERQDAAPASNSAIAGVYRDKLGRCAIKGNHSRRGDWIYHLPGRPYYDETRPEALFCTEQEALAAGYRPSRAH